MDNKLSSKPLITKELLKKLQEVLWTLTNSEQIFNGSNSPLKRCFLNMLSLNQSLTNKKLSISAEFPVNIFIENDLHLNWLREVDLNH